MWSAATGEALGYGELAAGMNLMIPARADVPLTPTEAFALMGTDLLPRVDIPGKVTGAPAYVHDLRPEGMLHARVVRPPSPAAELTAVDTSTVEAMPGFVAVVRDGSFLAVVAEREFQAVLAMRALAAAAEWRERESLPEQSRLYDVLRELETEVGTVAEAGSPQVPDGERTRRMTFSRPYMMHGSIGPSCAVALMDGDALTVWSHTQGVYPDREAISELLGMPLERVRVIHVEGAGLLRPQRRRRRGGRCGADRARGARPAGPRAVDARAGARLGALRPGHDHGHRRHGRRGRAHQPLHLRPLEQQPLDAAGRRREADRRRSISPSPYRSTCRS